MQHTLFFKFRREDKQKTSIFVRQKAEEYIADVCLAADTDKVFIVADSVVADSYARKIQKALRPKAATFLLTVEATEEKKNLNTLYVLAEEIAKSEVTNKSAIVAVGGGIVGNIAGMLAGLLFRGIRLIHVPTTLLAQVDSAADVKQSVNCAVRKNLLGVYYAPAVVVIDVGALKTLPIREIRSGLAESIKHALAQDRDFIDFIDKNVNPENIDPNILEQVIVRTLSLKIRHWEETPTMWNDPPGKRTERLTHLGHTTGKVIEILQKDEITHGEAISHGMIVEAICAYKMGVGSNQVISQMREVFGKFQLLYPFKRSVTTDKVIKHLYGEGAKEHSLLFALLKEVANPHTISTMIPREVLEESLVEYGLGK